MQLRCDNATIATNGRLFVQGVHAQQTEGIYRLVGGKQKSTVQSG
jgi:hypothetical protein